MYLLKNLGIAHNVIFHVLYRLYLILQITLSVVLLSFPLSYANEHGATVLTVPVAIENFPDGQEELETLLHHETGLKEPRVYKCQAPQYCKKAMQLIPSWLKSHYGTLPLSVREESATQAQLSHYFLSQAIELIESDTYPDDVSFVSVLDKKIAQAFKKNNLLSLLPFQGTKKSSINLLEHKQLLWPFHYAEKKVPIIFAISFNLWKKMFQHHASDEKTIEQLSCMHKKLQCTFDKASLTLPTHITFLDVSNKHHVEHLHQNMLHLSSVIVQTYGQQTVVLMPPISEQHPYHDLLDSTGQFLFNKEIDLSASDHVLNYESRLAYATLYFVHLNPGDILLVPANWFIYRKSLSTSISLSLNYLSGDQWCLFSFQAESMKQTQENECLTQEKCAVIKWWANIEIQNHPHNARNILNAYKKIKIAISDATQQVLNLSCLKLSSLPDAIFRIPHLNTLDLSDNKFTSLSLNRLKNLVSLNLAHNKLTSFSLNHAENIVLLNLACNQLTSFFLDDTKRLASLELPFNKLTSFSLNHVKNLISLNLKCNQLISFSLSYVQKRVSLDLSHNQLTVFLLNHVKNLVSLNLQYNNLTSFSLDPMKSLECLDLSSNALTSFFLNHVKNLTSLKLAFNQLTSFSLSHVEHLVLLNLEYNKLTSFSLDDAKNLDSLNLAHNQLTSFSLSDVENLVSLNLKRNQLTSFDLNHMKSLDSLNLAYNKLTSFSLSHVKNLVLLHLTHNKLTSFSLSHVKNLGLLDLTHNQLTSFSLHHVGNLASLDLVRNQLTSFSLSHIQALASLDLSNN